MDSVDIQILMHLQEDARSSFAEIARRMGRAESTVRDRVRALERSGVVLGYMAQLDLERLGLAAQARAEGRADMSRLSGIVRKLQQDVHVRRVDLTTGARPVAVQLLAASMADVDEVVRDVLEPAGLEDVEVQMQIQSLSPERPLRLARLIGPDLERADDVWLPMGRERRGIEQAAQMGQSEHGVL